MKKTILILIVCLLASCAIVFGETQGNSPYRDLTTHWAREYVLPLSESGLFQGYNDGTFKPDNKITVAEFIKIVMAALGEEVTPGVGSHWYLPYVQRAEGKGIVSQGEFNEYNRPITRGEIARMVVRALKDAPAEGNTQFSDDHQLGEDRGYIKTIYALGIMGGYGDGTFKAEGNATRGEAARVITSMLNPEKRTIPEVVEVKKDMVDFSQRIEGPSFLWEDEKLYYISPKGEKFDTMTNSTLMTREELNWYFKTIYQFVQEHDLYFTLRFSEVHSSTDFIVGISEENFNSYRSAFYSFRIHNNGSLEGMEDLGHPFHIYTDNLTDQASYMAKVDVKPFLDLTKILLQQSLGDQYQEQYYTDYATFQINKVKEGPTGQYYGPIPLKSYTIGRSQIFLSSPGGFKVAYDVYKK